MVPRHIALQLLALLLTIALCRHSNALYVDSPHDLTEATENGQGDELGNVEDVSDPRLYALDTRFPFLFAEDDADLEDSIVPSPLKRGRYNRMDILKRSRLNRLIHRLLAMRGDRYSYHRASPVRFAAGKR